MAEHQHPHQPGSASLGTRGCGHGQKDAGAVVGRSDRGEGETGKRKGKMTAKASEMSLRQIAKVLGVSHTLLVLWRQGKRKLSPELEARYRILVTNGGYNEQGISPPTAVQSQAHGSEASIQSPPCYHYTTGQRFSSGRCYAWGGASRRSWRNRSNSWYTFSDQPTPNTCGVKSRGSSAFHQRSLTLRTVGNRKSYGTLRKLPTGCLLLMA